MLGCFHADFCLRPSMCIFSSLLEFKKGQMGKDKQNRGQMVNTIQKAGSSPRALNWNKGHSNWSRRPARYMLCAHSLAGLTSPTCVFVQFGENRRVLQALRTLLEEFREELREEETRRRQLQQSYANDKAAWEVKWAEMKCQVSQVQMASQCPPLKGQNTIWCRKLAVRASRQ